MSYQDYQTWNGNIYPTYGSQSLQAANDAQGREGLQDAAWVVTYYTQQQAAIIGKTTVPFMSERKSDAIAPAGIGENPHSRLIEVE